MTKTIGHPHTDREWDEASTTLRRAKTMTAARSTNLRFMTRQDIAYALGITTNSSKQRPRSTDTRRYDQLCHIVNLLVKDGAFTKHGYSLSITPIEPTEGTATNDDGSVVEADTEECALKWWIKVQPEPKPSATRAGDHHALATYLNDVKEWSSMLGVNLISEQVATSILKKFNLTLKRED